MIFPFIGVLITMVILAVALGIAEAWTEKLAGGTGPDTKIETGEVVAADESGASNPYLPPTSELATEVSINGMLTFEIAFGVTFLQAVFLVAVRLMRGVNWNEAIVALAGSYSIAVVGMLWIRRVSWKRAFGIATLQHAFLLAFLVALYVLGSMR